MQDSQLQTSQQTVRVWDPLVRIFHWSLALAFMAAYLSAEEWDDLHEFAGYTVAGLVAFRLVWGLVGSRNARFTSFVSGPRKTLNYLRLMVRGKPPRYLGHNPAGAAMIVALLLALTGTAVMGMALLGHHGEGPLAGTWLASFRKHDLKEVHEFFANTTLFLVCFHVAGVLVSSLMHRENLARAMVTGRKRKDDSLPPTESGPDLPAGHNV